MVGEWAVIQLGLGVRGSRQTDNGAQRLGGASATKRIYKETKEKANGAFLSSFFPLFRPIYDLIFSQLS